MGKLRSSEQVWFLSRPQNSCLPQGPITTVISWKPSLYQSPTYRTWIKHFKNRRQVVLVWGVLVEGFFFFAVGFWVWFFNCFRFIWPYMNLSSELQKCTETLQHTTSSIITCVITSWKQEFLIHLLWGFGGLFLFVWFLNLHAHTSSQGSHLTATENYFLLATLKGISKLLLRREFL